MSDEKDGAPLTESKTAGDGEDEQPSCCASCCSSFASCLASCVSMPAYELVRILNPNASEDEVDFWKTIEGKPRNCRNLICCLIFVIFGIVHLGIFGWSLSVGNPYSLMYGRDYVGNICGATFNKDTVTNQEAAWPGMTTNTAGSDTGMATYPNTLWPRINEDLASPPNSDLYAQIATNPLVVMQMSFTGICVQNCPSAGTYICEYGTQKEIDVLYPAASGYWTTTPPSNAAADVLTAYTARVNFIKNCVDNTLFGVTGATGCTVGPAGGQKSVGSTCYSNALDLVPVMTYCMPKITTVSNTTRVCKDPVGLAYDDPRCKAWKVTDTREYDAEPNPNPIYSLYSTTMGSFMQSVSDVNKTLAAIMGFGLAFPLVAGFLFVFILNKCVKPIVYSSIILVVTAFLTLALYLLFKGGVITSALINSAVSATGSTTTITVPTVLATDTNNQLYFQIGGWTVLILTLIVVLIIIAQKKQIATACAIIVEGAKAMEAMPSMVLYPFSTVIQVLAVFLMFVYGTMCIYSAGSLTIGDLVADLSGNVTLATIESIIGSNVTAATGNASITSSIAQFSYNDASTYLFVYQLFFFLWINQYIQFFSICCISGAVICWYEEQHKPEEERKALPWFLSFKFVPVTMWFYMGAVAFGSALVAIVQLIRLIVAYIQETMAKQGADQNMIVQAIMCVVQCCLWCVEGCVKAVSDNAYTLVMALNMSFCGAGAKSLELMFTEVWCFAIAGAVTNMVVLIGKVFITTAAGVVLYIFIDNFDAYKTGVLQVNSAVVPVLLGALLAWFMASCFMFIYEYTMNCILMLFLYYKNQTKLDAGKHVPPPAELQKILGQVKTDAPEDMKEDTGKPVVVEEPEPDENACCACLNAL